ncbi:Myosin-1 [Frankliniella fusca]|uniref:Myosin-1 n=1 Tax=Frankliniella fusca TaxID=407009 RepID=A0AAE1HLS4_9NEOP|nr:Myosin-1 [Frankliniella fusca]
MPLTAPSPASVHSAAPAPAPAPTPTALERPFGKPAAPAPAPAARVLSRAGAGSSSSSSRSSRPTPPPRPSPAPAASEAQRAVDSLFASCSDSDTWTSYSLSCRSAGGGAYEVPTQTAPRAREPRPKRLKTLREYPACPGRPELDPELDPELEDDAELSSELEAFRLLASDGDADDWRASPDPADIFPQARL